MTIYVSPIIIMLSSIVTYHATVLSRIINGDAMMVFDFWSGLLLFSFFLYRVTSIFVLVVFIMVLNPEGQHAGWVMSVMSGVSLWMLVMLLA